MGLPAFELQFIIEMKIGHDKAYLLARQIYYPQVASRKCIHLCSFACWFLLVFLGTTLIGIGASNNSVTYSFCPDSQTFCTQNVLFNDSNTYYFYVKLEGIHQNNRLFMDSFSVKQLHGEVDKVSHCSEYYTYGSLGVGQTVGGYRVNGSAHLHPCGEVMKSYAADTVYLIDGQGGTPQLNSGSLTLPFSHNYHFKRLDQYQMAQWVDVMSHQFVNYFTYALVGSAAITAGNYQVVMQNNLLTQGQFSKWLVISETGILGITNHLMGFTLFAWGLLLLFLHVYICFSWRK